MYRKSSNITAFLLAVCMILSFAGCGMRSATGGDAEKIDIVKYKNASAPQLNIYYLGSDLAYLRSTAALLERICGHYGINVISDTAYLIRKAKLRDILEDFTKDSEALENFRRADVIVLQENGESSWEKIGTVETIRILKSIARPEQKFYIRYTELDEETQACLLDLGRGVRKIYTGRVYNRIRDRYLYNSYELGSYQFCGVAYEFLSALAMFCTFFDISEQDLRAEENIVPFSEFLPGKCIHEKTSAYHIFLDEIETVLEETKR